MTALTLYPTSAADTLLTTANTLTTSAPTPEGTALSRIGNASTPTFWARIASQSYSTPANSATELAPNDHGWLWDVTTLEGQQLNAGSYTFTTGLNTNAAGATATADIHCRLYKRSSGGVYTLILDAVLTAQTINHTGAYYTITGSTGSATSFSTGDKLYYDQQVAITAYSSFASNTSITVFDNLSTKESIVTPGYSLLSTYKDVTSRFLLMSANQLKDVVSRFRLKSADTLKDVSTRFRQMSANQLKDTPGRFRLMSANQLKDVASRFRQMSANQLRDVASRFRQKSADQPKDTPGRLRLRSADQPKDVISRFKLALFKDVSSRFRLALLKDITSRLRLRSADTLRDVSTRFLQKSADQLHDLASRFLLTGATTKKDITCRFILFAVIDLNATVYVRSGMATDFVRSGASTVYVRKD